MPRVFTEPLCVFLACGLVFHLIQMNRTPDRRKLHTVLAGVYFGYLALTKVLFGYVIAAAIVLYLVVSVIARKRWAVRALMVACVALAVCVPYLHKTYSLTGKVFYWAQSGGLSLYWMSSPLGEEYGDWLTGTKSWVRDYWRSEKHHEFLESLQSLNSVERDQTLRKEAVRNMLDHPGKFAKNWVANVTRLFLHYPFSYKQHAVEDLRTVLSGAVLLVLCLLCTAPTVANWRSIPAGVQQVFLIGLFYVGGSSVLSAYDRMLLPVVPLMAVWLTYMLSHTVRPGCLHLRFCR
jgi:4-amino-4-deoxy-L-arabinose transferase-like glycosyltransferase